MVRPECGAGTTLVAIAAAHPFSATIAKCYEGCTLMLSAMR